MITKEKVKYYPKVLSSYYNSSEPLHTELHTELGVHI